MNLFTFNFSGSNADVSQPPSVSPGQDVRPADAPGRREAWRAIGRALGIFFLTAALYQTAIWSGRVPPSRSGTQWDDNLIRAQAYSLTPARPNEIVLVGSSLTANLPVQGIGPAAINLGMAGGSAQTGLELVESTPGTPQIVLVEINETLTRPADKHLLWTSENAAWRQACLRFSALRAEFRPVSVALSALRSWKQRRAGRAADQSEGDTGPLTPAQEKLRQRLIAQNLAREAAPLSASDAQALRVAARQARIRVDQVGRGGARVALFSPPGETAKERMPRQQQIRALLRVEFPPSRYRWILTPPNFHGATHDGAHLIPADARRYAAFLRAQISEPSRGEPQTKPTK